MHRETRNRATANESTEIRVHGRGGQGGVTCAKILAAIYARRGLSVQAFGDYASERSGAPVRAYTRISNREISERNKVYHPDHLVVLDPSLLGNEVLAGLARGGSLLLNTPKSLESLSERFGPFRLATVDATAIARRHKIGTRSVVIVNTCMAGAFARLHGVSLEDLRSTFQALGFASNFSAAQDAYDAVRIRSALPSSTEETARPTALDDPGVVPIPSHLESPPTNLKTGTWSSQHPIYREHLAPCNAWCPAGNDVVGFVQALAREDEAAAARILGNTTPLAGVCGRVCPAPCAEGCNRREHDGAVNIRGLERWIADHHPGAVSDVPTQARPARVAIVGGGPAGLSAAYSVAREGHHATIFEGEDELGGLLRTGIPTYRLPRNVLDREVQGILDLGVEARCGEVLDPERIGELSADYDAVILATGLQKLRKLVVPGADLDGVEQGIRFLRRINLSLGPRPVFSGPVVVLGGGNTAIDCARSALRLGAEKVTVVYRRTRLEMPAIREEIEEAEQEGVEFLIQRQPVRFFGRDRLDAVELAEVEMGEPDESGRRAR